MSAANEAVSRLSSNPLPPLAPRAWLRYDLVARLVDRLDPKQILEIGSGQGAAGARLAARYAYLGVEPDPKSFAIADGRITPHGGVVINGTDAAVPRDGVYDLVCAFEVLEHIEDDAGALADWVELIASGGHFLMSVPAFQGRFGPMDRLAGHFRRYEPEQLKRVLEQAGLVDVEVTVYGWPLGYALESVRNRIDAKKLAANPDQSIEELTAASGRTFQPAGRTAGEAVRLATLPFRYLQRMRPSAGTGLVAVARKP
jgi:SAM-dependent methyltransferase